MGLQLPAEILHVESPLRRNWGPWQKMIAGHPDQEFAAFLLRGIWEDFRTGLTVTTP